MNQTIRRSAHFYSCSLLISLVFLGNDIYNATLGWRDLIFLLCLLISLNKLLGIKSKRRVDKFDFVKDMVWDKITVAFSLIIIGIAILHIIQNINPFIFEKEHFKIILSALSFLIIGIACILSKHFWINKS